jgi:hypothetical protein
VLPKCNAGPRSRSACAHGARGLQCRARCSKLFVDVGGVGAGVYDQLKHLGEPYATIVEAVNFGASGGPLNRRAEMWLKSRQWLEDAAGVQIPDSDSLQVDACGPAYRDDALSRRPICS